ncbi:hypothetical protein BKA62DRAFT_27673 [Auriculariales sp. MPI-PUGE-AT-0066]|nr:hypothetical protein BKA62DRAFT_27673 [Auriculariales sp. MPI-PUGE-AT-0066]
MHIDRTCSACCLSHATPARSHQGPSPGASNAYADALSGSCERLTTREEPAILDASRYSIHALATEDTSEACHLPEESNTPLRPPVRMGTTPYFANQARIKRLEELDLIASRRRAMGTAEHAWDGAALNVESRSAPAGMLRRVPHVLCLWVPHCRRRREKRLRSAQSQRRMYPSRSKTDSWEGAVSARSCEGCATHAQQPDMFRASFECGSRTSGAGERIARVQHRAKRSLQQPKNAELRLP